MSGEELNQMIDVCSHCEGFLKTETGIVTGLVVTLIAAVIRMFEKRKMKGNGKF